MAGRRESPAVLRGTLWVGRTIQLRVEQRNGAMQARESDMANATISIQVDEQTARAFAGASAEQQRKLQLLLNLRLRELTAGPARPLKQVMDDIGARAEAQGLTPDILESLLDER